MNMPHQNIQGMKSAVLKSIDVLTLLQLLLPAAQCVCVYAYVQYVLSVESSRVLMLQKPLDAGSLFSPQCHYESVKIKTQPQAGSQPNSANWLSLTLFL